MDKFCSNNLLDFLRKFGKFLTYLDKLETEKINENCKSTLIEFTSFFMEICGVFLDFDILYPYYKNVLIKPLPNESKVDFDTRKELHKNLLHGRGLLFQIWMQNYRKVSYFRDEIEKMKKEEDKFLMTPHLSNKLSRKKNFIKEKGEELGQIFLYEIFNVLKTYKIDKNKIYNSDLIRHSLYIFLKACLNLAGFITLNLFEFIPDIKELINNIINEKHYVKEFYNPSNVKDYYKGRHIILTKNHLYISNTIPNSDKVDYSIINNELEDCGPNNDCIHNQKKSVLMNSCCKTKEWPLNYDEHLIIKGEDGIAEIPEMSGLPNQNKIIYFYPLKQNEMMNYIDSSKSTNIRIKSSIFRKQKYEEQERLFMQNLKIFLKKDILSILDDKIDILKKKFENKKIKKYLKKIKNMKDRIDVYHAERKIIKDKINNIKEMKGIIYRILFSGYSKKNFTIKRLVPDASNNILRVNTEHYNKIEKLVNEDDVELLNIEYLGINNLDDYICLNNLDYSKLKNKSDYENKEHIIKKSDEENDNIILIIKLNNTIFRLKNFTSSPFIVEKLIIHSAELQYWDEIRRQNEILTLYDKINILFELS